MANRAERASTEEIKLERDVSEVETAAAFGPGPTAEYIADLAAELAAMARKRQFDFLAQLLEMAQLEASAVQGRLSTSGRVRGGSRPTD